MLATRQTVEGEYLRRLIETHAADCTVVSLPAAGLVEFVEEGMFRASPRGTDGAGPPGSGALP